MSVCPDEIILTPPLAPKNVSPLLQEGVDPQLVKKKHGTLMCLQTWLAGKSPI